MAMPACPVCKTNKHVNRHGREEFYCGKCQGLFDSDSDEGGNYFADPARRLELAEERQKQRRNHGR